VLRSVPLLLCLLIGTTARGADAPPALRVGASAVALEADDSMVIAGGIGPDQLKWLEADLADRGSSTPIVVFTHVPMWSIYMRWGWGTQDAPQALVRLVREGGVRLS